MRLTIGTFPVCFDCRHSFRYWELHNLVLEHFGEEPYPDPLDNLIKHLTEEEQ